MLGNGMRDVDATSGTSSDLRHTEGLMLHLRPQAAGLTAIKSLSSDKEGCKCNPTLSHTQHFVCILLKK